MKFPEISNFADLPRTLTFRGRRYAYIGSMSTDNSRGAGSVKRCLKRSGYLVAIKKFLHPMFGK